MPQGTRARTRRVVRIIVCIACSIRGRAVQRSPTNLCRFNICSLTNSLSSSGEPLGAVSPWCRSFLRSTFQSAVGRRSELCSKLLSVALMKDSVNFANRRHDHVWSTDKCSRSPPWSFVAPRAHTVLALVRPRGLGPHRSSGSLQLSTCCSSLASTPSRFLAVGGRLVVAAYASASGATSGAANPTSI